MFNRRSLGEALWPYRVSRVGAPQLFNAVRLSNACGGSGLARIRNTTMPNVGQLSAVDSHESRRSLGRT